MNPLSGKNILLGITGGIAAYKVPLIIRELKRKEATVKVIMTDNSKRFVTPLVISTLSDELIDSMWEDGVPHIDLTDEASLLCIIPADYNIIGKAASGIADDLLSTIISASSNRILFFPSMNYRMYENPVLQRNIKLLQDYNHVVIEPDFGELATRAIGKGRLPGETRIVIEIEKAFTPSLLKDSKCLITGGGTAEKIDPVRYLTNRSSGKMAYSLARYCYLAGAQVDLIMGITGGLLLEGLPYKWVQVQSAKQLEEEILKRWDSVDYLFMSAAVSDFTLTASEKKIKKKEELSLKLRKNIDILANLKSRKNKQYIIGFSVETENLLKKSKRKITEKELDLLVANDVSAIGSDDTSGYLIDRKGKEDRFECSKDVLSWKIIKEISSKKP